MGLPYVNTFRKPGKSHPLDFRDPADTPSMRPHLAVVTGIDPRVTEQFLLRQPAVIDASVWYHRGRLHAEVEVVEGSTTPASLLNQCVAALGPNQAPKDITLVCARPRAA